MIQTSEPLPGDVGPGSPIRERDQPNRSGRVLKNPLVVYEKRDNAMRLVAADGLARRHGAPCWPEPQRCPRHLPGD